ncbi:MAG: glycosyltransferase [Lachnospiraceae bacterium]|nr:glycosyltransferase [Lachnospiraceae bacterium]
MAAISVLMAVYNCDKYLREAMDSILNQTWSDFEFIIVNDGSTDNSLQILKEYSDERIKIITYEENKGVAHARNVGLEHCTSEYVALMDADDIALPDRLKLEYEYLMEHREIDGVYAKFRNLDVDGRLLEGEQPRAYYNYRYVKAVMIFENTVANLTAMFRRQIVEEYQLKYDETCKIASDYRFWIDYLKYGKIVGIDKVLCYYRLRHHSLYNNSPLSVKKESERQMIKYNLKSMGFRLLPEEESTLIKIFSTDGRINSGEELLLLYMGLLSMAKQAKEMNLEFAEEVKIMCKKRFLEKVQNAPELWDW